MGMKICVLIFFLILPWISRIGDWALRWTEGDEVLQVVFVMLVFPVIMNATQYYIIDSFIKNQNPEGHERIPDEDGGADSFGRRNEPYEESGSSDEIHSEDEGDAEVAAKADVVKKAAVDANMGKKNGSSSRPGSSRIQGLKTGHRDYDPLFDGESSPTVAGSSSTSERLALKEADSDDEETARR